MHYFRFSISHWHGLESPLKPAFHATQAHAHNHTHHTGIRTYTHTTHTHGRTHLPHRHMHTHIHTHTQAYAHTFQSTLLSNYTHNNYIIVFAVITVHLGCNKWFV